MKKLLIPLLILALLAGCAPQSREGASDQAQDAPEASPTAEPAEESGETDTQSAAVDYQALYEAAMAELHAAWETYDPETVVCTVNGSDVTWGEFFYFLSDRLLTLFSYTGSLPEDYDTALSEDVTLGSSLLEAVENQCKYFAVGRQKAAELGVSTPEDSQGLQDMWATLLESYGDEEALMEGLYDAFLTRDLYAELYRSSQDLAAVMAARYGESGEKLSAEDVTAWARDRGFIRVKHVLYANFDDAGSPLEGEALEQAKAKAEASLAELRALAGDSAALEARFDELMAEDTDDAGGLAQFPEGYTFTEGTMYEEFEEAAFDLEEYGLSELVESQSGWHIILRLPLDPEGLTMDQDANTGGYMTLRSDAANDMFNNDLLGWIEQAELKWEPAFEDLDLNDLFGLEPAPAETAEPEE